MPNTLILPEKLSPSLERLRGLDFSRFLSDGNDSFLKSQVDRAEARLVPFTPITAEERLRAFRKLNYSPHGLFLPDDEDLREQLLAKVTAVGDIRSDDDRLNAYHALQDETERWQLGGVVGKWTGQQGVARSKARFRIVAWGRRGGKTTHASYEALGVAIARPRSWVWLAAPTIKLADRAFEKVKLYVEDLGLGVRTLRDSGQDKLIILENGSKIEAISLENIWSAAGAAIDFAVIDEAAQITPEAWYRAILPPLSDRNGQALLISSWEGEGDFFHEKAKEAEREMFLSGKQATWELFQDASYDVNFYAFPQGRRSPALVDAEKEMPIHDFLEQFGAIPAGARERVFPEFKERVHVVDCPYNPDLPILLTCDPSGGANAYAIAVIQEYPDRSVVVDEFYEDHVSTEEIAPVLASRPWAASWTRLGDMDSLPRWKMPNVTDMIVDSAVPEEIRRWDKMGFPAYGVPNKPKIEDRLPLYRNMLRDPVRFRSFYRKRVNEVLRQMGFAEDADLAPGFSPEAARALAFQVEEALADFRLSDADVRYMRSCSRLFVHKTCVNAIDEHKSYSYPKKRRLNMSYQEKPRGWKDHLMDALGYYVWTKKRFEGETAPADFDYLGAFDLPTFDPAVPEEQGINPYIVPSPARTQVDRFQMFLDSMRPVEYGALTAYSY